MAHDGSIMSRIGPNALGDVLDEKLGTTKASAGKRFDWKALGTSIFKEHWGQKLIALALGLALFLAAHEKVTLTMDYQVLVQNASPGDPVEVPVPELLAIHPPPVAGAVELHIVGPHPQTSLIIEVTGPRAAIQELQGGIGGVLELDETSATDRPLSADEFRWGAGRHIDNLSVSWKGPAPTLKLEPYVRREFTPSLEQIRVDRGDLPRHLEFVTESMRFRPNQIEVRGPADRLENTEGKFVLAFADLRLGSATGGTWSGLVRLTENLEQEGFELLEPLYLEVDLRPLLESLGEIKKDVILLSFDPNQDPAQERYERPDQPVRIQVRVSPLLENATEEDRTSLNIALRDYIQSQIRVYVDVDRKRAPGSNKANVELELRRDSSWDDARPPALQDRIEQRDVFPLEVALHPDDTTLWLNPLPEKVSGPNNTEGAPKNGANDND